MVILHSWTDLAQSPDGEAALSLWSGVYESLLSCAVSVACQYGVSSHCMLNVSMIACLLESMTCERFSADVLRRDVLLELLYSRWEASWTGIIQWSLLPRLHVSAYNTASRLLGPSDGSFLIRNTGIVQSAYLSLCGILQKETGHLCLIQTSILATVQLDIVMRCSSNITNRLRTGWVTLPLSFPLIREGVVVKWNRDRPEKVNWYVVD